MRVLAGLALCGSMIGFGASAPALADPMMPDAPDSAASPGWAVDMSRTSGIVTVPSWVSLTGGSDASRYGSLSEGLAANGRVAVAYGETGGLDAASAGNTAPSINPEDRRTVNMRADGDSLAGSTVSVSTSMSETHESILDAPSPDDFGAHRRTAAGAGAAVSLLDGRVHLSGEFAGSRLDQSTGTADAPDPNDALGFAHRVRADIDLLDRGTTKLSASLFQRSAEADYAVAGPAAPDWDENGGGMRFAIGSIVLGLDGMIRRNNLADNPAILTQHEQTLQPSIGLALDRLRGAIGVAFPSAIRFGHAMTHTIGAPVEGGTLSPADATDANIQSDSFALDWSWNAATRTSLGFTLDRTAADQPGKETADSRGRGVSLNHAIGGRDLVTTLAAALREAESDDPANPGHAAFADLSAAIASRHGPFGGMIASFLVRHASDTAADATDAGTTWRARAAFDVARLPSARPGDGRVTMALSFNGNAADPEGGTVPVEMVLGLAARTHF